jgi:uncharacterized protein (TIGR00255 family)
MTLSQPGAPHASPVRSMTGFARVRKPAGETEIVLSVKSVNHRALDLHFHCPSELDPLENDMRALVRKKLTRGHVEVRIGLGRTELTPLFRLNRDMLQGYLSAFRAAAAEYGIDSAPDLNSALRVPGMFTDTVETEMSGEQQAVVLGALEEALDALNRAREREASEMLAAMLRHNESIRKAAQELAAIRQRAIPLFEARLSERLRDLLRGQAVDPQRLAQEVAMLVDRSDISEEIARLEIHASQLDALLTGGGEVGKKLDFLLQEMNRETNTILSKTSGIGELGLRITELALATKADIEKIREQSLNLE